MPGNRGFRYIGASWRRDRRRGPPNPPSLPIRPKRRKYRHQGHLQHDTLHPDHNLTAVLPSTWTAPGPRVYGPLDRPGNASNLRLLPLSTLYSGSSHIILPGVPDGCDESGGRWAWLGLPLSLSPSWVALAAVIVFSPGWVLWALLAGWRCDAIGCSGFGRYEEDPRDPGAQIQRPERAEHRDIVDEAGEESFPASDAPSGRRHISRGRYAEDGERMPDIDKAADVRESPCPRCGGEAACLIPEPEGDVEVFCPTCGRFRCQAIADIPEGEGRGLGVATANAWGCPSRRMRKLYTSRKTGGRSGTLGPPNAGRQPHTVIRDRSGRDGHGIYR